MNPPTDREKALAVAATAAMDYFAARNLGLPAVLIEENLRHALTAPTPAAPTDGPWCYDLEDGSLTRDKEFFAYVRDDCGGPLIAENALILLATLNRQQEAQP